MPEKGLDVSHSALWAFLTNFVTDHNCCLHQCLPCSSLSSEMADSVLFTFASFGFNTVCVMEWACIKYGLRILQSGKKSQEHQIPFLLRTELMKLLLTKKHDFLVSQ